MPASVASGNTVAIGQSAGLGSDPVVFTFGPFAAGWADQILPLCLDKNLIIDAVSFYCVTKPSTDPSNLTIFRGAAGDTDIAGIITAALDVTTVKDLNELTNFTRFDATVNADNNLLLAGDVLVLDTNTAAAMAGLSITIRGRLVR